MTEEGIEVFGKRHFSTWEMQGSFSAFLACLKPPSLVKKMFLWGNTQSPQQPQGWIPAVWAGDAPLSSYTWKHHLGVLSFPWATHVGSNCICWEKAGFEAVFSSVLLLPAPFMLTQSLFGLHLRGPRNSCATSNSSSTPVLITLSKGD